MVRAGLGIGTGLTVFALAAAAQADALPALPGTFIYLEGQWASALLFAVLLGGVVLAIVLTFLLRETGSGTRKAVDRHLAANGLTLKVKLALSIIGISSIHLLKSFINAGSYEVQVLMWQTIIHVVFLLSALAIALTDKLTQSAHH